MVRGMAGDPNSSMVVGGVVVNRKSPAPASSSMMVTEAERLEEARHGEVRGTVRVCVCGRGGGGNARLCVGEIVHVRKHE